MPVRHQPATPWSRVKHSTTEPLRSQLTLLVIYFFMLLLSSANFFQSDFPLIIFHEHYQNVKQFGSRSGPTSVGPDLDPNCLQR